MKKIGSMMLHSFSNWITNHTFFEKNVELHKNRVEKATGVDIISCASVQRVSALTHQNHNTVTAL